MMEVLDDPLGRAAQDPGGGAAIDPRLPATPAKAVGAAHPPKGRHPDVHQGAPVRNTPPVAAPRALGTSEVALIELVAAYAPFANGGDAVASHVVERVRTPAGKVLFEREAQNLGQIIEPRYVGMMNAMLRETLLIGTAQRAQVPGW